MSPQTTQRARPWLSALSQVKDALGTAGGTAVLGAKPEGEARLQSEGRLAGAGMLRAGARS